jgi:hypothetical protein
MAEAFGAQKRRKPNATPVVTAKGARNACDLVMGSSRPSLVRARSAPEASTSARPEKSASARTSLAGLCADRHRPFEEPAGRLFTPYDRRKRAVKVLNVPAALA